MNTMEMQIHFLTVGGIYRKADIAQWGTQSSAEPYWSFVCKDTNFTGRNCLNFLWPMFFKTTLEIVIYAHT